MAKPYQTDGQAPPMYTTQPSPSQQAPLQEQFNLTAGHQAPSPPTVLSSTPQVPPQHDLPPHQPPSSSSTTTLQVQNASLQTSQILITSPTSPVLLYTISIHERSHFSSEPHLTIQSPTTNNNISTIRFHSISSKDIDLTIQGHAVDVKDSWWSSDHEMESRAGAGRLRWRDCNVMRDRDMKCTDQTDNVIARFEADKWTEVQKSGRFILSPTIPLDGMLMDEVITSGIAFVEYRWRKSGSGYTGKVIDASIGVMEAAI